jgi:hypothetical protein
LYRRKRRKRRGNDISKKLNRSKQRKQRGKERLAIMRRGGKVLHGLQRFHEGLDAAGFCDAIETITAN